jgi:hypothetical protein
MRSLEEFQVWLANEVEVRDELEALIGSELGLDEGSLDTLEAYLLHRYARPEDALRPDERDVLDAAARHVGLVILLNVDGTKWDIDLDDENALYYRLPVIRFSDGTADCPLSLTTASLDRRTGNYLRTVVENCEELYNTADQ